MTHPEDEKPSLTDWKWQGGSQTFLGRDIFGAYWGLVILGFVDAHRPIAFPAGRSLIHFVEARNDLMERFLELLEARTGLHPEVVQIARRAAPWVSETGLDEEMLCCDISLMVGRLVGADELHGDGFERLPEQAAEGALERLVDALVGAIFCFGDRRCDLTTSAEDVLTALAVLVGEDSAPGRAVRVAFSRWLMARLPEILDVPGAVPDYVDWLRYQIPHPPRIAGPAPS